MADAINRCNAEETAACCCVDVGTIIDNKSVEGGVQLTADFTFSCEAENLIFQLGLR